MAAEWQEWQGRIEALTEENEKLRAANEFLQRIIDAAISGLASIRKQMEDMLAKERGGKCQKD